MLPERDTIRRIREAVTSGHLDKTFRAADVNAALKMEFAGVFLPKHRVGNPGGFSKLFVRLSRGLLSVALINKCRCISALFGVLGECFKRILPKRRGWILSRKC
jgi:hypothetical protein